MLISSVVILVMTFATLGLLLGAAATFDGQDLAAVSQDDAVADRDPAVQSKLFDQCLSEANDDGTVSEEEYFACAYGIYG